MYTLEQSQTALPLLFLMLDSADHVTPKTGLSPTVTLSKNGAAFGAPAGAVTELATGWYTVAGNATDTDTVGPLVLHAEATGADPVDVLFLVGGDPVKVSQLLAAPAATDGTQGHTVGEALTAARAQGFGKWVLASTTLSLYGPDGTTLWRAFTLDDATTPTSRT